MRFWLILLALAIGTAMPIWAGETTPNADASADSAQDSKQLESTWSEHVLPLVQSHCVECHDSDTRDADLDLTSFATLSDVVRKHGVWESVARRVESGEMPPEDASTSLTAEERTRIVDWIRQVRRIEATKYAGDPGPVLARRLSNAEYDYCIRDLTGHDLKPTKTFPVDPANEAGFDNSGESLAMSPALLGKYIEAARFVVDHLVLKPSGIRFAPHTVVTDTDRDKYCVNRIIDFYKRQPTDLADYFYAAWIYRHRDSLGKPELTLDDVARAQSISPKYLRRVYDALNVESSTTPDDAIGPLAEWRAKWNALPSGPERYEIRVECEQLRDYVVRTRKWFEAEVDNLKVDGIHAGAQCFVLCKNRQYAANRRVADLGCFDQDNSSNDAPEWLVAYKDAGEKERERLITDCQAFCDLFPDTFVVTERGRDYVGTKRDEQEKGRLLSAGFHSMMGYYRDDAPLYDLVLGEAQRAELDELWRELDFITSAPMRQYQGFLWFERTDSTYMREPEFDFARPEDQAALSEEMIRRLGAVYTAKAIKNGAEGVALDAIHHYFRSMNDQIRAVEKARVESESKHLEDVLVFASKAYRRPLQADESAEFERFYRELRDDHELTHEEAIQDLIVAVLMSPAFCYRVDLMSDSDAERPLDPFELASRLSFFLWSSVPDEELLEHAARGDLTDRDVLLAQTRRMLRHDSIRALATEFGANWLDFRRFEEHNSVDRERFPTFDSALRSAMFEEPIRFLVDTFQNDRSVLDLVYSHRTFVNRSLAKHYGIRDLNVTESKWVQVADASQYGRGGLLPMAVFLTKNSPGLRTSPVKRGYWVVKRILGEHIPAPPPNVPELPSDESKLGELTLRETLAMHRDHASCSGCHNRIDSVGLVFEGFGPVGERRELDLGGKPIDAKSAFPDASEREGIEDLRDYIREHREADFVDNLARKLVSYGLGRSLILPDELLIDEMRESLVANDYRFGQLVETIVLSPQFLNKRGRTSKELTLP